MVFDMDDLNIRVCERGWLPKIQDTAQRFN